MEKQKKNEIVNILVVEDNLVNQKIVTRFLEKMNYRTSVAANGKQAIEMLSRAQYDLILMDVQMPEMDGLTATQIIRDTNSQVIDHHTPIIALTAHAGREECLSVGMNGYIAKPFTIEKLKKSLTYFV